MSFYKRYIFLFILLFWVVNLSAQYTGGFLNSGPPGASMNQQEISNNTEDTVTTQKPAFSIGKYFKALAHKDTMNITQMGVGSIILPGTAQIYNKQYWKLPLVYGSIGGFIGGAVAAKEKDYQKYLIAGAVACYWGSLMDGVISYKSYQDPLPGRAALYSAFLPGLGQAYNRDYWKIPVFYAGFMVSGYCWAFNQKQYKRYKNIYTGISDKTYTGPISAENAKWFRDQHRRYRDYSIIATALIYVLNIVDANVFAFFNDFDISDDLTFDFKPSIINSVAPYNIFHNNMQSYGVSMQLNF